MAIYTTHSPSRPTARDDGLFTRSDIRYDSDAERLCRILTGIVESMGASDALTRAVVNLEAARNAIADHVERRADVADPYRGLGQGCFLET